MQSGDPKSQNFIIPVSKAHEEGVNKVIKATIEEVQQLAEKHYKQAMKYIYRKQGQQENIKARKEMEKQRIDPECTFKPRLTPNKYLRKYEEMKKGNPNPKHIELAKWGRNHDAIRRQEVIKGQISQIRYTVKGDIAITNLSRSVENLNKSIEGRHRMKKSFVNEILETERTFNTSSNKKAFRTVEIPGVQKHYLKQIKASISSQNKTMYYKSDAKQGLIIESRPK